MIFSSLFFMFLYLPVVLLLNKIVPPGPKNIFRNTVLFLVSLLFYAWGEPLYVILMLLTITIGWGTGLFVDKAMGQGNIKAARFWVAFSVIVNLAILAFFKYADFFIGNINGILGTSIPLLNIALPVGISFYTFQTLSYTIDVYRKDAPVQPNFISFGAYIALFPQLIAGPIVRYLTIAEQLNERSCDEDKFASGIKTFTVGLAKKVLLANTIGALWDTVIALPQSEVSVLTSWLGIIAYAFQIYFDFSGYSDMAIGLGRMLGFEFDKNFDYPYASQSVTEFWRRWHISLGTWFREYLYIPLGGNRVAKWRYFLNIFIVWFCTGFWHGAGWNFILWGLYFGLLLVIEKAFLLKLLQKIPRLFRHVYLLLTVLFSWVFFAIDDMSVVGRYFGNMFGLGGVPFINDRFIYLFYTNAILIAILGICATPLCENLKNKLALKNRKIFLVATLVGCLFVWIVSTTYLVSSSYNPFLYFRF